MARIKNNRVYAKLPNTGLGNKMLVWARAFAAACEHNMELFVSPWWGGIRAGPWIRRERKKRLYLQYFREDGILKRGSLFFFRMNAEIITEEPVITVRDVKTLYVFEKLFTDADYFKEMKPYRAEIRKEIYRMLHPSLKKALDKYDTPVIGVHIRRGDFKRGSTITPEEYFIESIQSLRKASGQELPVTVFTDADPGELARLYALPSVKPAELKADILDILLLSRSRICILSVSSTFSFWAGFLGDAILLKHPLEWHPAIRPPEEQGSLYEDRFDPGQPVDPRLLIYLKKITDEHKDQKH